MSARTSDAATRLAWAAARYWWLAVLTGGAVMALAVLLVGLEPEPATYRARASVVATDLDIDAEQLPRFSEAVFRTPEVLEGAIRIGDLPWEPDELRGNHAEIEPLADNVLIEVFGLARDPELAARTANAVAQSLAAELNRPGPGIGVFVQQSQAPPPDQPEPDTERVLGLAGGGAAALLLAAAVVSLAVVRRRPLLEAGDVEAIADVPVVGTLRLPRRERWVTDPTQVWGLSAVLHQLLPAGVGTVALVSPEGEDEARRRVLALVAQARTRVHEVSVVPVEPLPGDLDEELRATPRLTVTPPGQFPEATSGTTVLVEAPSPAVADVPQLLPSDARVFVVLGRGTAERRLLGLVGQFLPGELSGAVFVRLERRWLPGGSRRSAGRG